MRTMIDSTGAARLTSVGPEPVFIHHINQRNQVCDAGRAIIRERVVRRIEINNRSRPPRCTEELLHCTAVGALAAARGTNYQLTKRCRHRFKSWTNYRYNAYRFERYPTRCELAIENRCRMSRHGIR